MHKFQQRFKQEVLKSDQLRLRILATLFTVFGALGTVGIPLIEPQIATIFPRGYPRWEMMAFSFGIAAYGWATQAYLGRLLERGQKMPLVWQYISTLVEISIPTIFIVILIDYTPAQVPFVSPIIPLYGVFIILSILRLDFGVSAFMGAMAGTQYIVAALLTLNPAEPDTLMGAVNTPLFHLSRGGVLAASGVIAGLVAQSIQEHVAQSLRAIDERNRIKGLFGQHVSEQVVQQLLEHPTAEISETRSVCIMFFDIRGFTRFSEGKRPEDIVDYLNTLFGYMIDIVNTHDGIINKFLGDGFMAVFGAPLSSGDDITRAVAAAFRMVEAIEELVKTGDLPPTSIGIGLHTGQVVTGTIGSEQRREYTIIGDAVNVASRIEALNKRYGSQILASGEVVNAADIDTATPLGAITLKGRTEPITVYQLA